MKTHVKGLLEAEGSSFLKSDMNFVHDCSEFDISRITRII